MSNMENIIKPDTELDRQYILFFQVNLWCVCFVYSNLSPDYPEGVENQSEWVSK